MDLVANALEQAAREIRARTKPVDPDEEQQARIRFVIIAGLTPYFLWYRYVAHGVITNQIFAILVLFILYSSVVYAALHFDALGPAIRRRLCFLVDTVFITYTMHVGDRVCAPMALTLFWQNVGYPYRFGEKFLLYGTLVSGTAFLLVIRSTPYWQQNWEMGYAVLIGFTAMPAFFVGNMVKKIRDAKRKAEAANETKTRFVANMSHEMRTPLNGILGTADLLAGTPMDPDQRVFLKTIDTSAKHLLSLVNDVLDISKIEEGKFAIASEDMDLHALVKSVAAMVGQQVSAKSLSLHVVVSPRIPFLVKGDITRLRQVLTNLLSNALKFTAKGGIVIRVLPDPARDAKDLATIRFEVSDTGIGMTKEQCGRIFERFTQADDSITRKFGGTGLGTTISKELVELMGGTIGVDSDLGKGTTFWFSVPFETVGDEAIPDAMAKPFMRTKVLLVSADDRAADAISGYLATLKVSHVKRVHNTGQAYDYANRTAKDDSFRHIAIVVREGLGEDPFRFAATLDSMGAKKRIRLVLVGKASTAEEESGQYRSIIESPDVARDFMSSLHYVLPYDAHGEAKPAHAGPARKLDILVAEDNEINQMVIQKLLERAGHSVKVVPDGRKALDALLAETFDLALLDLNMPEIGGIAVAREYLRSAAVAIPLIALTADATIESRKACQEAGMKAYISKPFETQKVLEVLQSVAANGTRAANDEPQAAREAADDPEAAWNRGMLDEDRLRELESVGVKPNFVRDLVWTFVRDADKHVRSMERALDGGELDAFRDAAHSLKGTAGSMGAIRVEGLADEMQRMPGSAPNSARYEHLVQIKREIARVRRELVTRYKVALTPGTDVRAT